MEGRRMTILVNGFLEWCRTRGAQRVSVTAYSGNAGATAFYTGLGFEPRNLTLELGLGSQAAEP